MTFFGEMLKFFRETPKKGREKICPPVSEVLDPLVLSVSKKTTDYRPSSLYMPSSEVHFQASAAHMQL